MPSFYEYEAECNRIDEAIERGAKSEDSEC